MTARSFRISLSAVVLLAAIPAFSQEGMQQPRGRIQLPDGEAKETVRTPAPLATA